MAEFPALPLWTDAYLADTSHLTDAERGRYDLMLVQLWRMPEVRFPNDDLWLARKFGRSEEDIQQLFRPLLKEFFKSTGNWLTQKRLSRERAYVQAQSEKQRARAKARWNKDNDESRGNATAGNAQSGNAPTPTPTPNKKEEIDKSISSSNRLIAGFDQFWDVCPKKVGKGAARKAHAKASAKTDAAIILAGMQRYAASRAGQDQQYTVHPATWLTGERWSDEIITGGVNGRGRKPTAHDNFFAGAASLIADFERRPEAGVEDCDLVGGPGRPLLPP